MELDKKGIRFKNPLRGVRFSAENFERLFKELHPRNWSFGCWVFFVLLFLFFLIIIFNFSGLLWTDSYTGSLFFGNFMIHDNYVGTQAHLSVNDWQSVVIFSSFFECFVAVFLVLLPLFGVWVTFKNDADSRGL